MTEYNLEKEVDKALSDRPDVLKKVSDNRRVKNRIRLNRVKKESENISVFGVKNVNVNAILKVNLWDRSIFTTDKLCRMFLSCTLEQLKKYEKKKRAVPLNMLWIVLIMVAVVVVILVVMFILLPIMGV